ncbi:zinc transport system ATP-binding protein [Keratinibaculum paraultunense]|uniref:Zinc transport system ATP-binding protein n=1 Tax=Keratinibaculum paraultunense TaxID=1278232 RepID=A0A4R3KPJ2_9FIRM|nr:metal ABC transporter ATP-binding protein [Keratinibaculum paraultunense]QQY79373.1 metal ABC transporter ATP-binding protein [Keratinibaculum paraultunense]TCS86608.1 zinc transport system ATP-binding protein [Keratinibaculum paraultunense]
MNSIITVKNLNFSFGKTQILKDINFQVEEGDYVAIVGPNGSGKTTLIKILLGLIDSYEGEIKFKQGIVDKNLIGYLPQNIMERDRLFPATVKEIVATGLLSQKGIFKFYSDEDYKKVDNILKKLRIEDLKDRKIGSLSGGQLQRTLLARALVSNPKILFLDEPTSALDPKIREDFYNILNEINREGITIIFVSHDIFSIRKYVNKVLYLNREIIFYGSYDEFQSSEEMAKYFGLY